MKNKAIKLTKIPYLFKHIPLEKNIKISSQIQSREGTIVAVKIKESIGRMNVFDTAEGRLGWLWEKDTIPAVLGFRMAVTEFAGKVPKKVSVGDELYLLCESGLVGEIEGVFPSWGVPMKVKVLGSIVDPFGKPMNLKNYFIRKDDRYNMKYKDTLTHIPLVVLLSTRMDSGKTTMACKVVHGLKKAGKKVVAMKLTGVAFSQDIMKLKDAGASPVYDFVDMGLCSTCGPSSEKVVDAALKLLQIAQKDDPDCILAEFGDSLFGEYHVLDILVHPQFFSRVKVVVLAANDFAGIKGSKDILDGLGIGIDLVTGPVVNSEAGIELVWKYFNLSAESNQEKVSKTIDFVINKCFSKQKQ